MTGGFDSVTRRWLSPERGEALDGEIFTDSMFHFPGLLRVLYWRRERQRNQAEAEGPPRHS
jgi:hypothetical protein